jgi:hypothetical protein
MNEWKHQHHTNSFQAEERRGDTTHAKTWGGTHCRSFLSSKKKQLEYYNSYQTSISGTITTLSSIKMTQSIMNTPRRATNAVTPASKASRCNPGGGVDNVGRRVSFFSPSESNCRNRVTIDDDDDLLNLTSAMTTLSVGEKRHVAMVTPVKETFHEEALKATSALKRAERGLPNDFLNERWSDICDPAIQEEETKEEPDFSSNDEDAGGEVRESYYEECLRLSAELQKAEAKLQKKVKAKKHHAGRRTSFHEEALEASAHLKKAEQSGHRRQPSSPGAATASGSGSAGRVRFVSPVVQRARGRKSFHEEALNVSAELKKAEESGQRRRSSSGISYEAPSPSPKFTPTPANTTPSPGDIATLLVGPESAAAISPSGSPQTAHGPEVSRAPALPNTLRPFSMFSRLSWMMGRNFYGEA